MEIKKNFARKIDSKTKKSTILGIVATYSVIVVPNRVVLVIKLAENDNSDIFRIPNVP